ncbi:hypothetical protein AAVH_30920 [Aphelenchoides avenae]|nr:hypothetical protein AAVH_30920 [Aphelenchus avenae]
MQTPTETLLESLRFLDRPSLDAVHISTKRLRVTVDKLDGLCLRFLKSAYIGPAKKGKKMMPGSYAVLATPADRRRTKETVETEEHAGERFAYLIASAFIKRMVLDCVPLTDRILLQMQLSPRKM